MAAAKKTLKTKLFIKEKTIDFDYKTSELEVQYPKEWFDKNKEKTPTISIPNYKEEDIALIEVVKGGIAVGNLSLNTAKIFIYQQFETAKASPITAWTSFGRQLGTPGTEMTPWSLVQIVRGELHQPAEPVDARAHQWSERAILLYLLSIYRISKVSNDKYRDTLERRLNEQLDIEGGRGMSYWGAFQLYSSWSKDPNYMKMIAAIDMFLYKFKTHPYAIMRMGTLVSRYRDCASLISLKFAMKILRVSSSELIEWVFVPETENEVLQMTVADQELCQADSYFPYQVDFQLVERSAYSSVSNPNFFHWIHFIGSLLGHKRSQNARFTFRGCLSDIGLNAILVAWVFGQRAELSPQFSADGKDYGKDIAGDIGEQEDEESSSQGRLWCETQGRNPKTWFALLKNQELEPPKCLLKMIHKQQDRIRETRPNTIGEYIKTQFSY